MQSTLCFIDRWSNNQSSKAQAGSENCRSQSKLPANFTQYTRRMPPLADKRKLHFLCCRSAPEHLSSRAPGPAPSSVPQAPMRHQSAKRPRLPLPPSLSPYKPPLSVFLRLQLWPAVRVPTQFSHSACHNWVNAATDCSTHSNTPKTHTHIHTHRHNQLISSNSMRALLKAIRASVDQIKAEIVY